MTHACTRTGSPLYFSKHTSSGESSVTFWDFDFSDTAQHSDGMRCMTHVCGANLSLPTWANTSVRWDTGVPTSYIHFHYCYILHETTLYMYARLGIVHPIIYAKSKLQRYSTKSPFKGKADSSVELLVEACLSVSVVTSVTLILSKWTLWKVIWWRHTEASVGWLSKHVLWFVGLCSLYFPRNV